MKPTNTDVANRLESMICNAPRAHCNRGTMCDCDYLARAAHKLRETESQEEEGFPFWAKALIILGLAGSSWAAICQVLS